jgi:hypothetical protein
MLNRNVIAATLFVLVGACGGSQDQAATTPEPAATNPETPAVPSDEPAASTEPAVAAPAEPAPAPEPPKAPELSGAWASDCTAAADAAGAPVFEKVTFTLTPDHWEQNREVFSDAACTKKVQRTLSKGTYTVGAPSAAVPGAFELELAVESRSAIADSAASAKALSKSCGAKFKAGKSVDVSAKGCEAIGLKAKDACATEFQIVSLEGDVVRFGVRPADSDLCTVEKRPTSIAEGPGLKRAAVTEPAPATK